MPELNEVMEIEFVSFEIKKLFGKYDVTFRLDQECNVLIGANGIGKTTILKLLLYFIQGDLAQLAFVPFERITMQQSSYAGKSPLTVTYEELFPKPAYLVERLAAAHNRKMSGKTMMERLVYERENGTGEAQAAELYRFLTELQRAGLYEQFIANAFFHREQPRRLKQFGEHSEGSHWDSVLKESEILTVNNSIERIRFIDGAQIGMLQQNSMEYAWLGQRMSILYFDAVSRYSLSNETIDEDWVSDEELQWAAAYPLPVYGKAEAPEFLKLLNKKEFDYRIFKADPLRSYVSVSGDRYKNMIAETVFGKMESEKKLQINTLITAHYFTPEFILDINNRASKYVDEFYKALEEAKEQAGEISVQIEENQKTDYEQYLSPILVAGSFFKVKDIFNLNEAIWGEDHANEGRIYIRVLRDFLEEVLPLCKERANMSEEVSCFERLLGQYMRDKYVVARPDGLHVYDRVEEQSEENEIDLAVISSGETKLILLLAVKIFGAYKLLVLDEPELSLSLVWQQTILPDLLSVKGALTILGATHSPYIVAADSMSPFITYLPQREE